MPCGAGVEMGRKLFVGNLPFSTDERRLEELFAAIGPVDTVNIVRDQMTGRARGFAFVEMQTDEAAQTAIQRLNDTDLDGRKIAVNEARPKPSGGGGGRGPCGPGGGGRPPPRAPRREVNCLWEHPAENENHAEQTRARARQARKT